MSKPLPHKFLLQAAMRPGLMAHIINRYGWRETAMFLGITPDDDWKLSKLALCSKPISADPHDIQEWVDRVSSTAGIDCSILLSFLHKTYGANPIGK